MSNLTESKKFRILTKLTSLRQMVIITEPRERGNLVAEKDNKMRIINWILNTEPDYNMLLKILKKRPHISLHAIHQ